MAAIGGDAVQQRKIALPFIARTAMYSSYGNSKSSCSDKQSEWYFASAAAHKMERQKVRDSDKVPLNDIDVLYYTTFKNP